MSSAPAAEADCARASGTPRAMQMADLLIVLGKTPNKPALDCPRSQHKKQQMNIPGWPRQVICPAWLLSPRPFGSRGSLLIQRGGGCCAESVQVHRQTVCLRTDITTAEEGQDAGVQRCGAWAGGHERSAAPRHEP
jgi:hypothetical protein